MIKVGDIAKYKTPINPLGSYGRVVEIGVIKDSEKSDRVGKTYIDLTYLDNTNGVIVLLEDIIDVYKRTGEINLTKEKEYINE